MANPRMIRFPRWNMAPCPVCRVLSHGNRHHCRTCGTVFSAVDLRARANAILIAKLVPLTLLASAAIAAAALLLVFLAGARQVALPSPTDWPPPGSANKQVAQAYGQFRQSINDARQGCEAASKALDLMISALEQNQANVYDARRAAEYAQRACLAAEAAVAAIPRGGEMPSQNAALEGRVIDDCQAAMKVRHQTAGEIGSILGANPSSVAIEALVEAAMRGEQNARQCSSGLGALAGATGIDLARLRE